MASPKRGFHDSLCELLTDHGLGEPRASDFTSQLIIHYPWVRRVGFDVAVQQLEQQGLEAAAAREATLELLAFELLGRLPYDRVLAFIREQAPPAIALGVCLRAARVRRGVERGASSEEPSRLRARLVRVALDWLR